MNKTTNFKKLQHLLANKPIEEKTLFLFNSPPDSGKDFISDFLSDSFGFEHIRFKTKLFDLVKTIFSIDDDEWEYLYHRTRKEIPTERLGGRSPREAMIFVSEEIIKPTMGEEYFGEALMKTIEKSDSKVFCCSDSGFPDEVQPSIRYLTTNNIRVVRIFRGDRTYEMFNDSRRYLSPEDFNGEIPFYDVHNNATLLDFTDNVIKYIINSIEGTA